MISVVIPAFRAADTIARAISSCFETSEHCEIIVVIDGKDDQLQDAIPGNQSNINVIQSEHNLGAPGARNLGLSRVSGEHVLFLDADDYLRRGAIDAQYQAACKMGAQVSFCSDVRSRV
jgi:glycosyltransferase involved in cell wall biosynthesis